MELQGFLSAAGGFSVGRQAVERHQQEEWEVLEGTMA